MKGVVPITVSSMAILGCCSHDARTATAPHSSGGTASAEEPTRAARPPEPEHVVVWFAELEHPFPGNPYHNSVIFGLCRTLPAGKRAPADMWGPADDEFTFRSRRELQRGITERGMPSDHISVYKAHFGTLWTFEPSPIPLGSDQQMPYPGHEDEPIRSPDHGISHYKPGALVLPPLPDGRRVFFTCIRQLGMSLTAVWPTDGWTALAMEGDPLVEKMLGAAERGGVYEWREGDWRPIDIDTLKVKKSPPPAAGEARSAAL